MRNCPANPARIKTKFLRIRTEIRMDTHSFAVYFRRHTDIIRIS